MTILQGYHIYINFAYLCVASYDVAYKIDIDRHTEDSNKPAQFLI